MNCSLPIFPNSSPIRGEANINQARVGNFLESQAPSIIQQKPPEYSSSSFLRKLSILSPAAWIENYRERKELKVIKNKLNDSIPNPDNLLTKDEIVKVLTYIKQYLDDPLGAPYLVQDLIRHLNQKGKILDFDDNLIPNSQRVSQKIEDYIKLLSKMSASEAKNWPAFDDTDITNCNDVLIHFFSAQILHPRVDKEPILEFSKKELEDLQFLITEHEYIEILDPLTQAIETYTRIIQNPILAEKYSALSKLSCVLPIFVDGKLMCKADLYMDGNGEPRPDSFEVNINTSHPIFKTLGSIARYIEKQGGLNQWHQTLENQRKSELSNTFDGERFYYLSQLIYVTSSIPKTYFERYWRCVGMEKEISPAGQQFIYIRDYISNTMKHDRAWLNEEQFHMFQSWEPKAEKLALLRKKIGSGSSINSLNKEELLLYFQIMSQVKSVKALLDDFQYLGYHYPIFNEFEEWEKMGLLNSYICRNESSNFASNEVYWISTIRQKIEVLSENDLKLFFEKIEELSRWEINWDKTDLNAPAQLSLEEYDLLHLFLAVPLRLSNSAIYTLRYGCYPKGIPILLDGEIQQLKEWEGELAQLQALREKLGDQTKNHEMNRQEILQLFKLSTHSVFVRQLHSWHSHLPCAVIQEIRQWASYLPNHQTVQEKNQYNEAVSAFIELLKTFSDKEFSGLKNKLALLASNLSGNSQVQKPLVKEEKLSLKEYQFLTKTSKLISARCLNQMLNDFKAVVKRRETEFFVRVCIFKIDPLLERLQQFKQMTYENPANYWQKIVNFVLRIAELAAPFFIKIYEPYGHVNFLVHRLVDNKSQFEKRGIIGGGLYDEMISGDYFPLVEEYEINFDKLYPSQLDSSLKQTFKSIFLQELNTITTSRYSALNYPQDYVKRAVRMPFQKTRVQPKDINFTDKQRSVYCSQFICEAIIKAQVETCRKLKVSEPDSLSFFGLYDRHNLETLIPSRFHGALVKKGILRIAASVDRAKKERFAF